MSNYVYEEGLLSNQIKVTVYLDAAGDGADDQSVGYNKYTSVKQLTENDHFETDTYSVTTNTGTELSFSIAAICTGREDTSYNYGVVVLENIIPTDINISEIKAQNLTTEASLILPLNYNSSMQKVFMFQWRIGDSEVEPNRLFPYAEYGTPYDILLTF